MRNGAEFFNNISLVCTGTVYNQNMASQYFLCNRSNMFRYLERSMV